VPSLRRLKRPEFRAAVSLERGKTKTRQLLSFQNTQSCIFQAIESNSFQEDCFPNPSRRSESSLCPIQALKQSHISLAGNSASGTKRKPLTLTTSSAEVLVERLPEFPCAYPALAKHSMRLLNDDNAHPLLLDCERWESYNWDKYLMRRFLLPPPCSVSQRPWYR
jgi:hypothetical protein